ncbi:MULTISPECIES: hypothetical protein [unclassified Streptomyces]|uniref:hypothetical protein n=1 Tax=Streptomyces TaxID=1883 RepID=UPI000B8D482B|nr:MULTISPECIES: hypothetical protein [unclassified Streptomyces]ASQ94435.1 hypothetical protein CGL27_16355 [Streptomyces sp. 11-1-2]RSS33677.1 hypothetical protein EF902_42845 [Streptomyces sp. WAC05858]
MTITIAALPDHDRTTDPLWQRLFYGYRHVITPLRYAGWVTDIETSGGEFFVRADLRDGTELIIASEHSLPADPAEVTGWTAIRQDAQGASRHTVLYDSTPNGPQRHHGNSLVPLMARIDGLDLPGHASRLIVSATHTAPYGANHNSTAGIEGAASALVRFAEWSRQLTDLEGYHRVWQRPERDGYPLALFERAGHITTVRVTRSDD